MSRVREALLGPLRGAVRVWRRYPGWLLGGLGAVLCVLGWYGVSGERYVARQLPYLASATAPGVALIVAGAVLVAAGSADGLDGATRRRIAELHTLLTEAVRQEAAREPGIQDPFLEETIQDPAARRQAPGHATTALRGPARQTARGGAGTAGASGPEGLRPAAPAPDDRPAGDGGRPLAVPRGGTYHRPECPLVAGKAEATPVDAAAVRKRGLRGCPVCEPEPPVEP